jgi:hypothetical protein
MAADAKSPVKVTINPVDLVMEQILSERSNKTSDAIDKAMLAGLKIKLTTGQDNFYSQLALRLMFNDMKPTSLEPEFIVIDEFVPLTEDDIKQVDIEPGGILPDNIQCKQLPDGSARVLCKVVKAHTVKFSQRGS